MHPVYELFILKIGEGIMRRELMLEKVEKLDLKKYNDNFFEKWYAIMYTLATVPYCGYILSQYMQTGYSPFIYTYKTIAYVLVLFLFVRKNRKLLEKIWYVPVALLLIYTFMVDINKIDVYEHISQAPDTLISLVKYVKEAERNKTLFNILSRTKYIGETLTLLIIMLFAKDMNKIKLNEFIYKITLYLITIINIIIAIRALLIGNLKRIGIILLIVYSILAYFEISKNKITQTIKVLVAALMIIHVLINWPFVFYIYTAHSIPENIGLTCAVMLMVSIHNEILNAKDEK